MSVQQNAGVVLPAACAVAASFDPALARSVGAAQGQAEVDPNIKRSPLCGRNFAMFSEDPHLTAALAAAAAAGIGAALLYRGTRLRGMAKDPDSGALWACLLPVVLITLYLLHTHVLHLVDGAYHTGQSCYGDMPMHLGFIKYIAQSGEFLPRYPLLGGTHRFGYPFLCETVSSVFVVLGADLRTAYLLPMLLKKQMRKLLNNKYEI